MPNAKKKEIVAKKVLKQGDTVFKMAEMKIMVKLESKYFNKTIKLYFLILSNCSYYLKLFSEVGFLNF